jgi:glycosyl transferase-like sugar-binding protein
MAKIPSIVHFVFGLREQSSPFHLLHYLAIESCRQVLQPDAIYMHYHHLPFGEFWDRIRSHLQLMQVRPSELIEQTEYNEALVPQQYRYAHHADVIRLDALIEHGGIYADIDTLFLRAYPRELFDQAFVIGREQNVADEITGESKPSLCNALLMSEPGGKFARVWRDRLASALNGTWSNHSCFLPQELSVEMPEAVHVEPETSFMSVPGSEQGISTLLEGGDLNSTEAYSIHLWEHLWWDSQRQDFSSCHAGDLTLQYFRDADTPLSRLARPFLPTLAVDDLQLTTS